MVATGRGHRRAIQAAGEITFIPTGTRNDPEMRILEGRAGEIGSGVEGEALAIRRPAQTMGERAKLAPTECAESAALHLDGPDANSPAMFDVITTIAEEGNLFAIGRPDGGGIVVRTIGELPRLTAISR